MIMSVDQVQILNLCCICQRMCHHHCHHHIFYFSDTLLSTLSLTAVQDNEALKYNLQLTSSSYTGWAKM